MQLQPGQRLGPYEIVERIGAGGMGEVYRAQDTRLSRHVAIKVLHGAVRDDSRLRARFEREAKAISSLNDPHICTLHDIGSHEGIDYLVLEYCEGVTLAQRLDRGALPVEEAIRYGTEIAAALGRAHRGDVVHRDLKPANIMLTKSGVKLLDFGLAKPLITTARVDAATLSLHHPISEEGSFVGTVQYMAPEILAGKEADARTDIFALGVVLYEMLAGKPAFSGASTPGIMAAILEREPQPIRELQPRTPPALEHIISRALAKNPDERWESAHDIAEQLRWISESPDAPPLSKKRSYVSIAAAGAALLLLAALLGMWRLRDRKGESETDRVIRLSIPIAQASDSTMSDHARLTLTGADLTRDGSQVAYSYCAPCDSHATNSRIYVRQLHSFETLPVPGTEGGAMPFFSPDGEWIGFFVSGELRRVPITGGTPQVISRQTFWVAKGMSWAPDGTIYFAPGLGDGLWSVPSAGGTAKRITVPDVARGENSHRWPQMLPDGEHVLFTVRTTQIRSFDQARLAVLSLKSGAWKVVLEGGTYGRYVSGQLLFARSGALYAVPFDLPSMSVRGAPRKVFDGVMTNPSDGEGGYRVSDDGDLLCIRGEAAAGRTEILEVDRTGVSQVLTTLPVPATRPMLSPDRRKLALTIPVANDEIWLYDFESAAATLLTSQPGAESNPIWAPDGTRLIYNASKRIVSQRMDGSGDVEVLHVPPPGNPAAPWMTTCSPDGKTILYTENRPDTKADIWILPLDGEHTPRPLLRTAFDESMARFSPDGKWIAYVAMETDHREIYVRSTKEGGQSQVSRGGGNPVVWSRDGKELFYISGDEMVAIPLRIEGDRVHPGKPRALFRSPGSVFFDVTSDGFLMLRDVEAPPPREISVILNWKRELLH